VRRPLLAVEQPRHHAPVQHDALAHLGRGVSQQRLGRKRGRARGCQEIAGWAQSLGGLRHDAVLQGPV
jgi:hypothetical protein